MALTSIWQIIESVVVIEASLDFFERPRLMG